MRDWNNHTCCFCGKPFKMYGNSTWGCWSPIEEQFYKGEEMRCCDECNANIVVPQREENMIDRKEALKK